MAKKNFKAGGYMGTLLGDVKESGKLEQGRLRDKIEAFKEKKIATRQGGRPKTRTDAEASTGCKPGEVRAAFIVNKQLLEQIKGIAHWERIMIKEVFNRALTRELELYLKKQGLDKVRKRPTTK
jgi:hypothetical protein